MLICFPESSCRGFVERNCARSRFMIGGAAVLDIELQKFFNALGIPMYQGYGLTEAAPVISANTPAVHKFGSSAACCRSWTYVLGREKSVLIGFDGEKYSPEGIEEALVAHSPYFDQLMLYNDHSAYTLGLVVPNKDALLSWLKQRKLSCRTAEGQEAALKLLQGEIDSYREENKRKGTFPKRWLPSAVIVLGEGFTEQNRMLNSTLKMVRTKITEFYQTRIDYALIPEGKSILNHQNRMIIKRFEEALGD